MEWHLNFFQGDQQNSLRFKSQPKGGEWVLLDSNFKNRSCFSSCHFKLVGCKGGFEKKRSIYIDRQPLGKYRSEGNYFSLVAPVFSLRNGLGTTLTVTLTLHTSRSITFLLGRTVTRCFATFLQIFSCFSRTSMDRSERRTLGWCFALLKFAAPKSIF